MTETENIEIIEPSLTPTLSNEASPRPSPFAITANGEGENNGGEKPIEQKRKRGGQPGNRNSVKHGIYSKFILLGDRDMLEGMTDGSLKDELALARACLKNALERKEAATTEPDRIAWDAAGHDWLEIIMKIKMNAAEKSLQANEIWDSLIEAIRATNDRQGVK
jgi:hypothetical protein